MLTLFIVLLSVVTTLWKAKFQDVNEKNMSHLLVSKSQKSWGKSGSQKSDLLKPL